jgi:hypothetical protein
MACQFLMTGISPQLRVPPDSHLEPHVFDTVKFIHLLAQPQDQRFNPLAALAIYLGFRRDLTQSFT